MTLLELLILSAVSWYFAFALTSTACPFEICVWIREHIKLGGLTSCIICAMPWIAIVLRLIYALINQQIFSFNMFFEAVAAAGIALWLHAYTTWLYRDGK